jgi:hypothetical protein
MKLLLENWRKYLNEEEAETNAGESESGSPIKTIGDFKSALKMSRLKDAGGAAGKKAAKMLIGMIPGGGSALQIFSLAKTGEEVIKNLMGAPDDVRTNTWLDHLNIDDDVSKIVDDNIEAHFIQVFMKSIETKDDKTPLNTLDADGRLKSWLADKFNQRTVVGGDK